MRLELNARRLQSVIIVITLVICAFFLAKGTTGLLANAYLPLKPASDSSDAHLASSGTGMKNGPPPGSQPADMKSILMRNIFDSATGALWPPKPLVDPNAPVEPVGDGIQVLAPGQMPPACAGSLKLVATVYSPDKPEWSMASINSGTGVPMLFREGSPLDGKTLSSIFPKAVYVQGPGASVCSLTLFTPPPTGAPAMARMPASPMPPTDEMAAVSGGTSTGISPEDMSAGITRKSDTAFVVQRTLLDKVLQNQGEIMRSARIVPHEQNGQVVGVKLYGIRRSSLLGELGLQNGDLLQTINGFNMASPDSALEAYTKLRSAAALNVSVTRRGQAMNLDYQIQ